MKGERTDDWASVLGGGTAERDDSGKKEERRELLHVSCPRMTEEQSVTLSALLRGVAVSNESTDVQKERHEQKGFSVRRECSARKLKFDLGETQLS